MDSGARHAAAFRTWRREMLSRLIEVKHPDAIRLSLEELPSEAGTVMGAGSDTTGMLTKSIQLQKMDKFLIQLRFLKD